MMEYLGCEAKDFWEEVRFELPATSLKMMRQYKNSLFYFRLAARS
jgi:hypothetical protein